MGAKAHWEVLGFGNALGGLIWPWRTHGISTVIVPEVGARYPYWAVIEPDSKRNVLMQAAGSDGDLNFYVIYQKDAAKDGRVFVVWPQADAIVGRWLKPAR